MRKRVRLVVTGRVQGVYYRGSCERRALQLGVAGTVRNRRDGAVEVVAEGSADAVDLLVDWCRIGPRRARVDGIQCTDEVPEGLAHFRIVG